MTPGRTTRQAVLDVLAAGPLDTVEIARTAKLDQRVVGAACGSMLREGILQRKVPKYTGPGKKPNIWRIKPHG